MAAITYSDIINANKGINHAIVKGKSYAEVHERVKAFRSIIPNGCIETELLSVEKGVCIIKAIVRNEEGQILGTGIAYEKEGSSFINDTSYIENCETSAVGRALAFLGLGIDTSIASALEVQNAIKNQPQQPQQPQAQQAQPQQPPQAIAEAKKGKLDTIMKMIEQATTNEELDNIARITDQDLVPFIVDAATAKRSQINSPHGT